MRAADVWQEDSAGAKERQLLSNAWFPCILLVTI